MRIDLEKAEAALLLLVAAALALLLAARLALLLAALAVLLAGLAALLARLAGKLLGHLYLLQRFLIYHPGTNQRKPEKTKLPGQKLMNARRGPGQVR